jgi:hypothetical protein
MDRTSLRKEGHSYQKRGISQAGESQTRFSGFSTPNVITYWLPLIVPG